MRNQGATMSEPDEWLSRKKTAALLARLGCPVAVRTLEKWASNQNEGRGPSFSKVRTIVRDRNSDVEAWVMRELVRVE